VQRPFREDAPPPAYFFFAIILYPLPTREIDRILRIPSRDCHSVSPLPISLLICGRPPSRWSFRFGRTNQFSLPPIYIAASRLTFLVRNDGKDGSHVFPKRASLPFRILTRLFFPLYDPPRPLSLNLPPLMISFDK